MENNDKIKPSAICKCPKCGFENHKWTFVIFDGKYKGKYCFNCFAKWIVKNCGKIGEVELTENKEKEV